MLLGYFHNIHFPFDIEVDTTIAVASEMVEELHLTDQDVSTVAAMIDSEIQSHIPDWTPHKLSMDVMGEDLAKSEPVSETKNNASLLTNESAPSSGSLSLERLPSGRKYWSDSAKAVGGSSPSKLGQSNLSFHGFSLSNSTDGDSPNAAYSPEQLDDNNNSEERENSGPDDLEAGVRNNNSAVQHTDGKDHQLGDNCKIFGDSKSDIEVIIEKLENLLEKQQKEQDELKRMHELAISDLLNEVSPEIRQEVLNICKQKYPIIKCYESLLD